MPGVPGHRGLPDGPEPGGLGGARVLSTVLLRLPQQWDACPGKACPQPGLPGRLGRAAVGVGGHV